ncbi:hypothetical protein CYMTET_25801 [Cymbomonas tetramitiformis]|uniref:MYND-type domain-containing protein n=1 Tax=Cymbomonas tetramitiformis TaxID=36881 RepID=A0AAE0FT05_9CHLO|nr:hypothetical protein CYMTET_25801 [Cymbomonas tetramitiformis]
MKVIKATMSNEQEQVIVNTPENGRVVVEVDKTANPDDIRQKVADKTGMDIAVVKKLDLIQSKRIHKGERRVQLADEKYPKHVLEATLTMMSSRRDELDWDRVISNSPELDGQTWVKCLERRWDPHKDGVRVCASCGATAFARCTACAGCNASLNTYYCTTTCQAQHWPSHKARCRSAPQ